MSQTNWVGFYRVKNGALLVGPYQGNLGCLHIDFNRGVCGKCARDGMTVLVKDVHEFEGHIACDSRTNSELVVPVFDSIGKLRAVLDLDSQYVGAFDILEAEWLEGLMKQVFGNPEVDWAGHD